MSEDKEKLSALLDDALSIDELGSLSETVAKKNAEPAFGLSSRYQMIGEAMRSQPVDAALIDISEQVREAIALEATVLSTETSSESIRPDTTKNSQSPQKQPLFDFSGWMRPLGGLAVAASVAMVTVFVVTQQEDSVSGVQSLANRDATTVNIPETVAVKTLVQTTPLTQLALDENDALKRKVVNLDAYLAEHAEFAAQDTLQGRMPYVRAVGYRPE